MDKDPAAQRSSVDRRFHSWVAATAALIAFTGFARTYYLKGAFGAPTSMQFAMPGALARYALRGMRRWRTHPSTHQHAFEWLRGSAARPAYRAEAPSASSIRSASFHFAMRSERAKEPTLSLPAFQPTAR
jgi:hypothetical protein